MGEPPTRSDRFLFLRKFLRHGTRVASVAPSSRALAREVCRHVTPERPQVIVELGAGTGAITVEAAERLHPDSRLIAVEIDPDFAAILTARCPRAEIICADVRELPERLPEMGLEPVDLVLSGLPTPSLPRAVSEGVFRFVKECAGEAFFSQLTVIPWVYLPLYRRLFEDVAFSLVPWNFPPGGVYHCRRLRDGYQAHLPGK
ncbi:MAG: methyltransferase domain-containing protein [Armatimonadetes bacterium]|nr:methyltransferase domain-containing protein [Armatimonadota bacterium]